MEITRGRFNDAWVFINKVQMTAFCIQEFIISGLYVDKTVNVLKIASHGRTRRTMWQLFIINVVIIALNIALLVVEYLNLRVYEQVFKGMVYSFKLKLEFAVLGKLVHIVRVLSNAVGDTADFMTDTRSPSDVTRVKSNAARGGLRPSWKKKIDETSSEHVERAEKPNGTVANCADDHKLEECQGYRGIEETYEGPATGRAESKTAQNRFRLTPRLCGKSPGSYTNHFHSKLSLQKIYEFA
jgi:hypothetical protein